MQSLYYNGNGRGHVVDSMFDKKRWKALQFDKSFLYVCHSARSRVNRDFVRKVDIKLVINLLYQTSSVQSGVSMTTPKYEQEKVSLISEISIPVIIHSMIVYVH